MTRPTISKRECEKGKRTAKTMTRCPQKSLVNRDSLSFCAFNVSYRDDNASIHTKQKKKQNHENVGFYHRTQENGFLLSASFRFKFDA